MKITTNISRHKNLINNFNYLSVLNFFQLLFPLIIYPYLIRVLGKEVYGLVVFANTISAYFTVFINFGFEISEIREISIYRNQKNKISEIVSSVIVIKTIFAFISILLLFLIVILTPELNKYKYLYFSTFGILLDTAINPRFFFQGIEKMKFITILTLISKSIFIVMIFILVKKPEHYILVPFLTSIGAILSSTLGHAFIFFKFRIRLIAPSIHSLIVTIKNSLPFFTARVSTIMINKTNILLIGSYIGYKEVSYYDISEKIINVMRIPYDILNQILFPHVSKTKNIKLVKKVLVILLIIYIFGYFSIYIIAEPIIKIFGGIDLVPAKFILYILSISTIFELASVFMGAPMLLAMGYKKHYNKSVIYGSIFYISVVSIFYLTNMITVYTLSAMTVFASLFILIYRFYYCLKLKLL